MPNQHARIPPLGDVEPQPARNRIPQEALEARYRAIRGESLALAVPLSPEDQQARSIPDASPVKWCLAHKSWFFETLVLVPWLAVYEYFDPAYAHLFSSCYEAVAPRHPRSARGLAAAFAAWASRRLSTEAERGHGTTTRSEAFEQLFEHMCQWSGSAYLACPGFSPAPRATGVCNGKVMVVQMVLKGSAWAAPSGHSRPSYRNFLQWHQRWMFAGLRLACDAVEGALAGLGGRAGTFAQSVGSLNGRGTTW